MPKSCLSVRKERKYGRRGARTIAGRRASSSRCPRLEHDRYKEAHECADGHHQWPIAPAVGHDDENDGHDELDSILRGRDDVNQLGAVAVGPGEPQGERADRAGRSLGGR